MEYKKRKTWRCWVADFTYRLSGEPIKKLVDADVHRYLKWTSAMEGKSGIVRLNYCLIKYLEFRNVFYYRMLHHPKLMAFSRAFLREAEGVEIGGVIDGGLYISHHHAVIVPGKAGKNLRVGPGVVIGRNKMGSANWR